MVREEEKEVTIIVDLLDIEQHIDKLCNLNNITLLSIIMNSVAQLNISTSKKKVKIK